MEVISHRGFWKTPEEKNKEVAFRRSMEEGFGMETDLRDRNGLICMSHDMPSGNEMDFASFCALPGMNAVTLALNIKSDGLAEAVRTTAQEYELKDWFLFDMSIPDMILHTRAGNPVFTRVSDVETTPCMLEQSVGIWLDAFFSDWYSEKDITRYLVAGKRVCVVSPELHKRQPDAVWERLYHLRNEENLIICTDLPDKAADYFK